MLPFGARVWVDKPPLPSPLTTRRLCLPPPTGRPSARWNLGAPFAIGVAPLASGSTTFADAVELAQGFTFPVVAAYRTWHGDVKSSAGAFVVLNSDGWIVTAAHMLRIATQAQGDRPKVDELESQIRLAESDATARPELRHRKVKRLRGTADQTWITSHSYWWAENGVSLREVTVVEEADLAVARLEPFDPSRTASYPVIKNPTRLRAGTSLCRLGFPFHSIKVSYDSGTDTFGMDQKFTFFPSEGIYTRTLAVDGLAQAKYPLRFLETSSPGLKGQSGGPVFDTAGRVWGVQSRTRHIPLGFNPEIEIDGKRTVEHQFINLGEAVHPETFVAILQDLGIRFELSAE
ncbi:MAG: serine protease [Chloroflexota bacterium]